MDADQIPIGMKLFPGNESEKPVIRKVIDDLKHRSSVTGRTIQIADKGLNCAENIANALRAGYGYIFSKSVKQLPETEKTWVLLQNDYKDVLDKNGKVKYRILQMPRVTPPLSDSVFFSTKPAMQDLPPFTKYSWTALKPSLP